MSSDITKQIDECDRSKVRALLLTLPSRSKKVYDLRPAYITNYALTAPRASIVLKGTTSILAGMTIKLP